MTTKELLTIAVNQKAYPQFINKYRAANDFTEKIITDNQLWFSNPLEFNDPYDYNTPINTSTLIKDIKNWLEKKECVPSDRIDEYALKVQNNPNIIKKNVEDAMKKLSICCFSTLEDCILQWSHYADYHKGICLKFDILEDTDFFTTPIIVSYKQIMQHYNHFIHRDKISEYLIAPKFHDWSYESEIRIVKQRTDKTIEEGQIFEYKNEALKEIIFGVKTPPEIIEKYQKLCAEHNKKHVLFYKMELGTGVHYQLVKKALKTK